ncbi:MAG: ankyrin repeat domain-containing protein [Cyanobacteria bacterium P01_C01_bin.89]
MRRFIKIQSRNQQTRTIAMRDARLNEARLIEAIREGDLEAVCSLLDSGCSPKSRDAEDIPGLTIAAQSGFLAIVEVLLASGAGDLSPDDWWSGYQTGLKMAIYGAADSRYLDILKVLRSEMPDCFRRTFVDICGSNDLTTFNTVINSDKDTSRYRRCEPRQTEIHCGNFEIVQRLIEAGADIDYFCWPAGGFGSEPEDQYSPLMAAAEAGKLKLVKFLIRAGASLSGNSKGYTAMSCAFDGRQKKVLDYLCSLLPEDIRRDWQESYEQDLIRDKRRKNIPVENFIEGAMLGQLPAIQWGIRRGVDVNAIGSEGQTALMYASSFALVEIVEMLLNDEADPNIKSEPEQETALMKVAASLDCYFAEKTSYLIERLVRAGADVNCQDSRGQTALMHAVFWPYPGAPLEAVKTLIDLNANIHVRDRGNRTALMHAESRILERPEYKNKNFQDVIDLLKS